MIKWRMERGSVYFCLSSWSGSTSNNPADWRSLLKTALTQSGSCSAIPNLQIFSFSLFGSHHSSSSCCNVSPPFTHRQLVTSIKFLVQGVVFPSFNLYPPPPPEIQEYGIAHNFCISTKLQYSPIYKQNDSSFSVEKETLKCEFDQ